MNRIFPNNHLPFFGNSHKVTIWGENGRKTIQIKIQPRNINNDCTDVIEEVSSEILDFVKSNLPRSYTRYVPGPKIILELPDSGGREIGTIFSSVLMKTQGELRLLLSIQRINDNSAKTSAFYNIVCPKTLNDSLKRTIQDAVKELMLNSSRLLRERACLRSEFHRLRTKNTN